MPNFDPSQNRNPWADCNKILHNWLRPRENPLNQIWYKSIHWGLLDIWVKYNVFVPFLFIPFLSQIFYTNIVFLLETHCCRRHTCTCATKFLHHLGTGCCLPKTTFRTKIGGGLGWEGIQKTWDPFVFMQPLKLATSNLVHNLGLGLAYQ